MSAKALMFMGTGSDVGKSLIVAGLCRAFKNRGIKVAPFKPQNMSNNAAVCENGGEIGRAQALQARAAKLEPTNAMNPILLKPEHETGAQVIVRGKRVGSKSAKEYFAIRQKYMPDVLAAFDELKNEFDLVIVEGAGSASEVNLRKNDLANFGFAQAANVPVVLIGDIKRGGVIASIIGTFEVIDKDDAKLIVGSIINKFQGDKALFSDGVEFIKERTKCEVFGVVPFFKEAFKLPAEDVLALEEKQEKKADFHISVLRLSRISNFDDFDPLLAEKNVHLEFIEAGRVVPKNTDLIIIPGTKATIEDMKFIEKQGWDIDIKAHVRAGGKVLGICGGYQILGREISDLGGVEGKVQTIDGLGLLDIKTRLEENKILKKQIAIDVVSGMQIFGYHIHMGVSEGEDCVRAFSKVDEKNEGATSPSGKVMGTYLHGLFNSDEFRQDFLQRLGAEADKDLNFEEEIEKTLDELALHFEEHLDLDAMLEKTR